MKLTILDKSNNNPVPWATVQYKNKNGYSNTIMADENGVAPIPDNTLTTDYPYIYNVVVSSVGYVAKLYTNGLSSNTTIYLDRDYKELEEVVVESKRKKSTGTAIIVLLVLIAILFFMLKSKR